MGISRGLWLVVVLGVLVGCSSTNAQLQQGAALYEAQCESCHGGNSGGTIRDVPPRHNTNGHTWHHPDCVLKEITLNGLTNELAEPDAPKMPAFRDRLSDGEVTAILAYLKTWWTNEQRSWQATVTQQSCLTPSPSL